MICYLTKFDDVIQSNFRVIPKITSANICKHGGDASKFMTSKLFHLIRLFESGKRERWKKITNIKISREQKELFR